MTIWAYYRVSSDEQTCESQKVGVVDYAKKHGIIINKEVLKECKGIFDECFSPSVKYGELYKQIDEALK